jgi:hypothetical protein
MVSGMNDGAYVIDSEIELVADRLAIACLLELTSPLGKYSYWLLVGLAILQ